MGGFRGVAVQIQWSVGVCNSVLRGNSLCAWTCADFKGGVLTVEGLCVATVDDVGMLQLALFGVLVGTPVRMPCDVMANKEHVLTGLWSAHQSVFARGPADPKGTCAVSATAAPLLCTWALALHARNRGWAYIVPSTVHAHLAVHIKTISYPKMPVQCCSGLLHSVWAKGCNELPWLSKPALQPCGTAYQSNSKSASPFINNVSLVGPQPPNAVLDPAAWYRPHHPDQGVNGGGQMPALVPRRAPGLSDPWRTQCNQSCSWQHHCTSTAPEPSLARPPESTQSRTAQEHPIKICALSHGRGADNKTALLG